MQAAENIYRPLSVIKKMKKSILHLIKFYKKTPKNLIPLVALFIVIFILFFGLPSKILYAKNGILMWLPFLVIFGCIPWLIFKTLNPHDIEPQYSLYICAAAIFIGGPSFGIWSRIQAEKELEINEKLTKGVIYNKWFSEDEWLVRCFFQYKGNKYSTFSEEDVHNKFQIGDSIMIRFSKEIPDNNQITFAFI